MTHPTEMFRYMAWPFESGAFPPALGAVVMRSVLDGSRPALQVLHDPEGDWGITDGGDPNVAGSCVATHIWHVVASDPSLEELASMPPGTQADRLTATDPWQFKTVAWDDAGELRPG